MQPCTRCCLHSTDRQNLGGKGGRNCLDSRVKRDGNGGVKMDGIGGPGGGDWRVKRDGWIAGSVGTVGLEGRLDWKTSG
jgi:hypothetical protein